MMLTTHNDGTKEVSTFVLSHLLSCPVWRQEEEQSIAEDLPEVVKKPLMQAPFRGLEWMPID